jgi:hypothetical protein
LNNKASNTRVQREKTQKSLAKEIDGDDNPADEIRALFDNYDEEELRNVKIQKDSALHYLQIFTELYYEFFKKS